MIRTLTVIMIMLSTLPAKVEAHALEPGYLELAHLGGVEWRVTWCKPQVQGRPMPFGAILSETCMPRNGAAPALDGRAFVENWVATCPGGLGGRMSTIDGLGFARALTDLGLPEGDVPLALLAFNLGVEAGQLMFIAAILAAGLFLGRLLANGRAVLASQSRSLRITAHTVGTLSAVWMIERVHGCVA